MDVVFKIEKENLQKVKNILFNDDLVSRASVVIKEAKSLGLEDGYYCYVSGTEEACKKAEELMEELGKRTSKEDEEKVIELIKKEEESAMTGFGGIFG